LIQTEKSSPLHDLRKAKALIDLFGENFPKNPEQQKILVRIYYPDTDFSDSQLKAIAISLYYNAYFVGFEKFSKEEKEFLENLIELKKISNPEKKHSLEEKLTADFSFGFHPVLVGFYNDERRFFSHREKRVPEKREEEAVRKVYHAFIELNQWSIRKHPVPTRIFLKQVFKKIFNKEGKEISIKDADGEDLETFCIYKFRSFGWEIPPDYEKWGNEEAQ
jgi:hypothetical protein